MNMGRTMRSKCRGSAWRPAAGIVVLLVATLAVVNRPGGAGEANKYLAVLKELHVEVKEMGPYPGDDFVRREFFVGEDDDDTNKDVQVVILIQPFESKEKMTIQVTEMVKDPGNSRTSLARTSRNVVCLVSEKGVEIRSSDYEKKDLDKLAPEILTAVRNKKRLLKMRTPDLYGFFPVLNAPETDRIFRT
jgi:hypothetical protein